MFSRNILICIIALAGTFGLSAAFCAAQLPFLRRLKIGQPIREEGPKEHLKKAGTPTMGGIGFIAATALAGIVCSIVLGQPRIIAMIVVMILYAVCGFADDWMKVVKHNSDGLSAKTKLLLQLLVAVAFLVYLYMSGYAGGIRIPFSGGFVLNLPVPVYVILFLLAVLGTDNAVNFTDGVDGLCSSITVVVALFFGLASLRLGGGIETLCFAVAGALLGFLLFNHHPAKVFMGDTGSLALGGFVAAAAVMLQMHLYIIIVGFVYLAEILSVVIQVTYFKKTGGKRIFRMTPIHHHFELGGWSENKVVLVFTAATLVLSIIGWLGI